MRVMVMSRATANSEEGVMPDEKLLTAMGEYNEALAEAGVLVGGEGLRPSTKGKRVRVGGGQKAVIDGPFAGDEFTPELREKEAALRDKLGEG